MNIGFEAKRFFNNFTGLGNYSRFVIGALSRTYPEHQYFLYSPSARDHNELTSIIAQPNVSVIHPNSVFSRQPLSGFWRSWMVSRHQTTRTLDIFHGLSQELPYGLPGHVKKIVTVHDLIFLRYPQFYNSIDVSIYKRKVERACKMADLIIAISKQTAADINHFMKDAYAEKIRVVYQGSHPNFTRTVPHQEIAEVRKKYNLPDRYLLNVGTIEERKNLVTLIRAMGKIPAGSRIPLVVIGRKTPYFEKVNQEITTWGLQESVVFIHNVDFSELPAIYQAAEVFIYPSVFEGFGIPLIEAIASGVPVITSTGSCFSEAAGPHAIYVHPDNNEEMAIQIQMLTSAGDIRHNMATLSKKYIQRFTPGQIANDMMQVYQTLSRNNI